MRYFFLVSRDNSVMNGIKKHLKSDKSWIWKFEMKNFHFWNVNKGAQWSIYISNIPRKCQNSTKIWRNFRENWSISNNTAKYHGKTNGNVNRVMKSEMRSSRLQNLKNLTKISVDSCKNDVYVSPTNSKKFY